MKPYFDLHFHPAFKPYLSDYRPRKRKNCWEKIGSAVGIVRSQSSLDQAREGGLQLGVATFIAVERPMTCSFLLDHVAPLFTVLDDQMLDFPNYANYFDCLQEELAHLEKSQHCDPGHGRTFKLLNSIEELEEDKLNLILAIEGGHNLENFNTSLLDNLRRLKQGPHRFLYLTLVHMTQYPLATHAYGMKLIKKNDQFKPAGFGLTGLGKEVIDLAYDNRAGHRILIDIKHMSLVSRVQFYRHRREKGYGDIPILATHMGVTGISRDPRVITQQFSRPAVRRDDFVEVHYDRPPGIGQPGTNDATFFNPWSINLYDEDITEVLDSGGLIGLNMDQRILGANRVKGEYFSSGELNYILSGYKDTHIPEEYREGDFSDEEIVVERELNERKHLRHLCNNILHIVKAGGERAWQQVCLGSDFDGLIDPINCCTDAADFPKLEKKLTEMLPKMMAEDPTHDYDDSDIAQKVRGLMYDNAVRFLKQHFV